MNNRLLNINILDHPTNQLKTVFFFTEETHATYFKELLRKEAIRYEFEIDPESGKHYFGIENRFLDRAKQLNFLVFARYRKPFISNPVAKYFLLAATLLFIILAVVGYLLNH